MKTSDFIIIEQPSDNEKWKALKAFLKALKIDFEIAEKTEIPEEHKELVRTRIKNRSEETFLDWDDVKNDFDGI